MNHVCKIISQPKGRMLLLQLFGGRGGEVGTMKAQELEFCR